MAIKKIKKKPTKPSPKKSTAKVTKLRKKKPPKIPKKKSPKTNTDENKEPPITPSIVTEQSWEGKPKRGRQANYGPAENLTMVAVEYYKWVKANPIIATELVKYKDYTELVEVPKLRAMTIKGLCIFLGIVEETWQTWRDMDMYKEVCSHIQNVIYEQKLTGAAADQLNAQLISRELGLADKKEIESPKGTMTPHKELTDEEVKEQIDKRGLKNFLK